MGFNKLKLYGDKNQVGNVDLSYSFGVRTTKNLFDHVNHVDVVNQMRRIGQPLAGRLK